MDKKFFGRPSLPKRRLNHEGLYVYIQNVRSIRGKLHLLARNINQLVTSPDVILLTETWLQLDIANSELGLKGYIIYRCDRAYNDEVTRGGGVLIVHSTI